MCCSFRVGTREELAKQKTRLWCDLLRNDKGGYGRIEWAYAWQEFSEAIRDPAVTLVAHNSFFEQNIVNHALRRKMAKMAMTLPELPPSRWTCTASLAAAMALPRDLAGAAKALKLKVQKDTEGKRVMQKLSQPAKPSKARPVGGWYEDPDDVETLCNYCITDLDVETALFLRLPMLTDFERQVWELDQRINHRGVAIDRHLVRRVLRMIDEEMERLEAEVTQLTGGKVQRTTQRARLLAFFADQGAGLRDLTAETVSNALQTGYMKQYPACHRLLEIRAALGKTSIKKYPAFINRADDDDRCRDNLWYHGASTGRWTGVGIQLHNVPRGSLGEYGPKACDLIAEPCMDLETVRLLFGSPMETFSSCLRGVVWAPKDRDLFCADFSAIEARVLFWVAKHEAGLEMFRKGQPIYESMAADIYTKDRSKVTKDEREIGKRAILGLGYQMGAKKFVITVKQHAGMDIPLTLAERAVKTYRSVHEPVRKLWYNLERAAIAAVEQPGKVFTINYTRWSFRDDFLWCQLPSGRSLAFAYPRVQYELPSWGGEERRPVLYHWGVDSETKQWVESGTYGGKICENICQAIARDLMAASMLRIERAGWEVILTIHDEILAEGTEDKDLSEFERLMAMIPTWAAGCPVKTAGWRGKRYRK